MKLRAKKITAKTRNTAIVGTTTAAALFTVLQWVLPQFGIKIPDKVLEAGLTLGLALGAPVAASFLTAEDAESFELKDLEAYITAQKAATPEELKEPIETSQENSP